MTTAKDRAVERHGRMMKILTERQAKAEHVRAGIREGLFAPDSFDKHMAGWDKQFKWSEKLAAIKAEAAAENENAAKARQQARNSLVPTGGSPVEVTARELRASRAWQRVSRDLDDIKDDNPRLLKVAMDRLGDADSRGVLLEELPSYLRHRGIAGQTVDSLLDGALARAVPEYGKAVAAERDTARVSATEQFNLQQFDAAANGQTHQFVDPGTID